MAHADSQCYPLNGGSAVTIRGGIYMLSAVTAGGALQVLAPDNTTWLPVQTVDLATGIVAVAGAISPISLPAGQVRLNGGSGASWLVGIG